jgi:hypothetical protein
LAAFLEISFTKDLTVTRMRSTNTSRPWLDD